MASEYIQAVLIIMFGGVKRMKPLMSRTEGASSMLIEERLQG
jgi:hypothetical protein